MPSSPNPREIAKLLRYDPETGSLYWLPRTADMFPEGRYGANRNCAIWNTRNAGNVAGTPHSKGYLSVRLNGTRFFAHRLAWALYFQAWPEGHIDHINQDKRDNRIANLRDVSRAENARNVPLKPSNQYGKYGVRPSPCGKKWVARIGSGKSHKHLGTFETIDAAIAARSAAEALEGYHPNHGSARNG